MVAPVDAQTQPGNLQTSFVRSATPFVVALVVGALAHFGVKVDNSLVLMVVPLILGFAYYVVARVLETKVNPKYGKLLGKAVAPDYGPAKDVALAELDKWKNAEVTAATAALTEQLAKSKTAFWSTPEVPAPAPEPAPVVTLPPTPAA